MLDFRKKTERLIFLEDYTKSTLPKETALMCIHAALMQREYVPRIYLRNSCEENEQWEYASDCLFSDHRSVLNWTVSTLKSMHISSREIQKISNEERQDCLRMIEENLENTLGSGRLYYEMSRFTPFFQDDITQMLSDVNVSNEVWKSHLYRTLQLRLLAKIQYHQKHTQMIHNLNLKGDWDMFHSVLKFKLEQLWQQTWLDNTYYQVEQNIINTIMVGDCVEE